MSRTIQFGACVICKDAISHTYTHGSEKRLQFRHTTPLYEQTRPGEQSPFSAIITETDNTNNADDYLESGARLTIENRCAFATKNDAKIMAETAFKTRQHYDAKGAAGRPLSHVLSKMTALKESNIDFNELPVLPSYLNYGRFDAFVHEHAGPATKKHPLGQFIPDHTNSFTVFVNGDLAHVRCLDGEAKNVLRATEKATLLNRISRETLLYEAPSKRKGDKKGRSWGTLETTARVLLVGLIGAPFLHAKKACSKNKDSVDLTDDYPAIPMTRNQIYVGASQPGATATAYSTLSRGGAGAANATLTRSALGQTGTRVPLGTVRSLSDQKRKAFSNPVYDDGLPPGATYVEVGDDDSHEETAFDPTYLTLTDEEHGYVSVADGDSNAGVLYNPRYVPTGSGATGRGPGAAPAGYMDMSGKYGAQTVHDTGYFVPATEATQGAAPAGYMDMSGSRGAQEPVYMDAATLNKDPTEGWVPLPSAQNIEVKWIEDLFHPGKFKPVYRCINGPEDKTSRTYLYGDLMFTPIKSLPPSAGKIQNYWRHNEKTCLIIGDIVCGMVWTSAALGALGAMGLFGSSSNPPSSDRSGSCTYDAATIAAYNLLSDTVGGLAGLGAAACTTMISTIAGVLSSAAQNGYSADCISRFNQSVQPLVETGVFNSTQIDTLREQYLDIASYCPEPCRVLFPVVQQQFANLTSTLGISGASLEQQGSATVIKAPGGVTLPTNTSAPLINNLVYPALLTNANTLDDCNFGNITALAKADTELGQHVTTLGALSVNPVCQNQLVSIRDAATGFNARVTQLKLDNAICAASTSTTTTSTTAAATTTRAATTAATTTAAPTSTTTTSTTTSTTTTTAAPTTTTTKMATTLTDAATTTQPTTTTTAAATTTTTQVATETQPTLPPVDDDDI